jgi:hypothetical protein
MREERSGKLVWDDQSKRGDDMWWKQQDIGRSKIRQLLRVEDNGFDLTGYDLGTVRTLRDYEKYAGIHFKKKSFQKWTQQNQLPPNPLIEDENEWENSFMHSFYHLVDIQTWYLPEKDYDFILVAFDDEDGIGIESDTVDSNMLERFLERNLPVHYEKMFLTDRIPARVVYWAHSPTRGWAERHEINF